VVNSAINLLIILLYEFRLSSKRAGKYNLFTPILFMLHGYGSNEQDLSVSEKPFLKDWIIVSFRAPRDTQFEGYSWYDINFNDPENLSMFLRPKNL
jgi:predicted esterase